MSDQNARLYARALFEAVISDWQRQLRSIAAQLGDISMASTEEQVRRIDAVLPADAPATLRNFLLTLVKQDDLRLLPEIADALGAVAGLGDLMKVAEIQSALPLSDEQRKEIEKQLADTYGSNLDIRYTVDPSILGGLIIRVGDQIIDTSVRTHLAALHRSMVGV